MREPVRPLVVDTTAPSVIRRKPLPPSTVIPNIKRMSILPGSATHPTMRRTWIDENGVHKSTETSEPSSPAIPYEQDLLSPGSPQVYGDQLFPVLPYNGLDKDSEILKNDGDLIVCIGQDAEMRMESTVIHSSKYACLIDGIQELSEEESADITQAAPYSKAPIRYVLELPTCSENDPNRHRTSIRNFFAALQSKPITGENLITELEKLYLIAVDLIGEPHNPEKAVKFVRKYVQRLKLDDCRYFRANALRLLAWCERTQWEKGWLESFAHCVGMMGRGIDECEAYTELSDRTKRLLHKSHRKQRHEIRAMERILADFDMVGSSPSSDPEHHAGIKSTRAFQQFLLDYYGQQYGSWPPKIEEGRDGWLDRTLAQRLQEDFGSVYDLLVNNNVVYGCLEHEETPQLLVIDDEDGSVQPLQTSATASEFPLWDVIQIWDTKCNFEPVPHPWVLLPKLRKITSFSNDSKSQQSLVSALQQHDADRGEEQSGLRNAYMKGTNGDVQLTNFSRAFLKHEVITRLEGVNTHDARLGRWLVIHCMMQLLSRVAVDIQGLWYCHGVPYFLNADLKHCPPWPGAGIPRTIREAGVEDSWCWIYAKGLSGLRDGNVVAGAEDGGRVPKPRFRVKWDDEGRWNISPVDKGERECVGEE